MVAPRFTEEEFAEIQTRYEAGETISQLAREYDVWPRTIHRRLNSPYLRRRPRWPQTLFLPDNLAVHAYIAGIIDGEGYISCVRSRGYHPFVRVSMTDEEVIDFLASFGATKLTHKPRENRKLAYEWNVSRALDVFHLLDSTLPYMRLEAKRQKATQVLKNLGEVL